MGANEVLHFNRLATINACGNIIGVYYDEARKRLLIAYSGYHEMLQIYRAHRKHGAVICEFDTDFSFKLSKLWSRQSRERYSLGHKQMYFDEATNHCVMVGLENVI